MAAECRAGCCNFRARARSRWQEASRGLPLFACGQFGSGFEHPPLRPIDRVPADIMNRPVNLVLSLLLLTQTAPATQAADGPPLPDPATVNAPDVTPSGDPKIAEQGYKFYYFHHPQVSFAQAYRDLSECRAHLAVAGPAKVPGFIPWEEAHRRQTLAPAPSGLVGAALAGIILPKLERGLRSNKMRRCMGTRGYDRYAIPESAWNVLNEGDERQLILMQAKLASGPKPRAEAVSK